jgi:oligoribonuclease
MDLEMTGLDPRHHVIVEIATLLTDDDLNIIAEGPDVVIHASEDQLALMDRVVVDMHTRSGLLAKIRESTLTLDEAGSRTLEFLRQHMEPGSVPLCGNSIGMDRRFLANYLPEVEEFLHYRSIDVSTIKELGRRWYPADITAAPRKTGTHRALDDIRESINELIYYRQSLFKPVAEPSVAS